MDKKLALVLLISVLFGAYAAEIYTQYGYGLRDVKERPSGYDDRSAIEISGDLRIEKIRAFPYIFFRGHQIVSDGGGRGKSIFSENGQEFSPLGFISNATTVLCNEIGKWQIYTSDEHGFNNPKGIWGQKNIDILALGDSFTHGSCVDPKNHMIGKIRASYPLTINLGRLGTGPLFQLAALREYGPELKPKTVLWFILEDNDIDGDLHDELTIPALTKYMDAGYTQNLISRQVAIDTHLTDYIDQNFVNWLDIAKRQRETGTKVAPWLGTDKAFEKKSKAAPLFGFNWNKIKNALRLQNVRNSLGISSVRGRKKIRLQKLYGEFENILFEAQKTVGTWNGKLQIIYLAGPTRYHSWRQKNVRDYQHGKLMQIFERQKLPVIDIVAEFENEIDPFSLFYGHYSPKGYGIVSERVLEALDTRPE